MFTYTLIYPIGGDGSRKARGSWSSWAPPAPAPPRLHHHTAREKVTAAMTSTSQPPNVDAIATAIAEAFEAIRAEWLELRDRGQPTGPLGDYVKVKGPQTLPAGTAVDLSWASDYTRGRIRSRARDLIVEASRARARELPPDLRHRATLSPGTAKQYIHHIVGALGPGPDGRRSRRKLSPAEVRFIRREHRPGFGSPTSAYALARLFGVNVGVIYKVVQRRTYRDVPDEAPPAEDWTKV